MIRKHPNCIVRRNILLLCIPVLLVLVFMHYAHLKTRTSRSKTGFKLPCNIPNLDPWDDSVREYIVDDPKNRANCSKRHNFFFVDQEGYLQLNHTTMVLYNVKSIECVYHISHRIDDFNISVTDEVPFKAPVFVPSRVFVVVCNDSSGKIIYRFVHVNMMWNEQKHRKQEVGFESEDRLSIIFIGMDSVSRSHALRSLPKTYDYLLYSLGAFDFKGHMKVGLNTYPNLMPLLTGKPHTFFHLQNECLDYFDNLPFIWSEEPMKSYILHHNEDRPNIGLFTNEKRGFKGEIIDYSYRHYLMTMKYIEPIIIDPLGNSTWACYGNKDHFELQIHFFKRFIEKYSKRLKFALFWNNQQTHDNFNGLKYADEPLLQLLKWLESNGHLDKAVVFVGSDHGFRLGGVAKTHIGRIENNMPFMTISLPKTILEKYPWIRDSLNVNTNRLTSHYDLYETIKQLIYMNFTRSEYPAVQKHTVKRSLFEKIPENRNCADAGIPDNFCSCQTTRDVDINSRVVYELVNHGVDYINKIIQLQNSSKFCRPLDLDRIYSATFSPTPIGDTASENITIRLNQNSKEIGRYTVLFYTKPNGGLYELMLDWKYDFDKDEKEMKVIGDPIRINLYGNQSHCVRGEILEQICLCYDVDLNDE